MRSLEYIGIVLLCLSTSLILPLFRRGIFVHFLERYFRLGALRTVIVGGPLKNNSFDEKGRNVRACAVRMAMMAGPRALVAGMSNQPIERKAYTPRRARSFAYLQALWPC